MHDGETDVHLIYWPRVKAILDGIMERWKERWGREPYPGIVLSGYRAIEPGVPGKDTHLVRSLARGVGGFGKMPLQGPFLSRAELDEIAAWIDAGMPEGPPEDTQAGG